MSKFNKLAFLSVLAVKILIYKLRNKLKELSFSIETHILRYHTMIKQLYRNAA